LEWTALSSTLLSSLPPNRSASPSPSTPLVSPSSPLGSVLSLFSPYLLRTTLILLFIWFVTNFAYTGVNVYLPLILRAKGNHNVEDVYRDTFLYSAAAVPGSLVGAWMVESWLGRRYSMFLATGFAAGMMLCFRFLSESWQVVASLCVFNLVVQIMYAAIYTYTPEVFPTLLRTTGVGVCSMMSRVAGVLAPPLIS